MRLSDYGATSILILLTMSFAGAAWGQVEIYDFPSDAPPAEDYQVEVDAQPVFVYDTHVAAIATFGLGEKATIRITRDAPFEQFVIRPLSADIRATREGRTVELSLSKPVQLSIEFDGDIKRPLYVFANPPEKRPESHEEVQYFGPGEIHRAGRIDLADGETLYIAGGAIVQGYVRAENANDLRILGPGILDASHRRDEKITSVLLRGCRDVELRDTLLTDSFGWTVHLSQCENVRIANMKQVGWRANSDGIDIEASRNVHVTDSFLRNADDCVAVKSKPKGDGRGIVTEDVLIERTVFWNSLPGNAMEIGFELRADAVRDITFRDCDIIRVERGAAFSIHNGDNAVVEDVLFENIRVEDVRGDFADMYIGLSIYSGDCPDPYRRSDPRRKRVPPELQDPASGDNRGQWIVPKDKLEYASKRGHIRNVTFRNIRFFPPEGETIPPSLFVGYDDDHAIENITFDGIFVKGRRIEQWPAGAMTTYYAKNVMFQGTSEGKHEQASGDRYLDVVRAYADAMVEHGRDRYGKQHSPLFAAALDRRTGALLEGDALDRVLKLKRSDWGIRPHDRVLTGANPMHNAGLYQVLYALTEITGNARYGNAADDAIGWFFAHCQSPQTGLMAWGEHIGWDFKEESVVGNTHEFYRPWIFWDRSFELAPEACHRFAEGLWEHQIADHAVGRFSRHAKYDQHGPSTRYEFPRHAGFYIATWAEAYRRSDDPVFLQAIETLLTYYESRKSPASGAIPAESHSRFDGKMLWPAGNVSLAIDLTHAAEMVPDELAARMLAMADSIDETFLRLDHELEKGGRGFLKRAHVDTLEPYPQGGEAFTTTWAAAYGQSTDVKTAMICVRRYRQRPLPGYRQLILAAADRYMNCEPDADVALWPGTMGQVILLLVEAHAISEDATYLKRAETLADIAAESFFDDASPLPKASSNHDHYEAITRADTLMMAMLKLWAVRQCPPPKSPLEFLDR